MKKIIIISFIASLLTSCGGATRSGVTSGILVSSWNDTIAGVADNSISVSKRGESCATNILGIVATGDSSIETAKRNGGVKKVAYADTSYLNVLGFYQKGCTIVKGE